MTDRITVGFTPAAPEPLFFAHLAKSGSGSDDTLVHPVVGWLIQHKYSDGLAVPFRSRVCRGRPGW